MAFLQHRDRQPELMDQPGLDEAEHRAALLGMRRVNWLSGGVPALWRELRTLGNAATADRPVRVLDVACGGGDVVTRLALRARRQGLPMRFEGCDISETALKVARSTAQAADGMELAFFQHDVLRSPFPGEYDVVMCSLFMHHLDEEQIILLLRQMAAAARKRVLVDDLLRTTLGYVLCQIGSRVLTRSRIVHVDGPMSVRAALTMDEVRKVAKRAGLETIQMRRHWPERFLMSWNRP